MLANFPRGGDLNASIFMPYSDIVQGPESVVTATSTKQGKYLLMLLCGPCHTGSQELILVDKSVRLCSRDASTMGTS
jgi:hypothetical protein